MQNIEDKSVVVDQKLEALQDENQRLVQSNVELEESIAMMEFERASYFLRFQNVIEESDENLLLLMTELLVDLLGMERDQIKREVDQVYRVNSNYARRNRVPREVHVRFSKRAVWDEILRLVRDQPLKYKDKDLVVLKQIPRRIRKARREYQFLMKKLISKGVNFRWLIPEGLLIFWDTKRYRLNTPQQAEDFFYNHRDFLERGEVEPKKPEETTAGTSKQTEEEAPKKIQPEEM
ncbi:uncharacterized protein LOC120310518 [Crotalus tigris]|uniref:uncharacterized protein LOC120310518 n=1 Tax=Crotalus tigris TaxID=88082 RepID=UPI00192F824A|nr:uncharacterized protein LOC120310518 [Crotalus tigris]XP_039204936.1 uncharacterized protein LOC120310518 [Crotalus tigris]